MSLTFYYSPNSTASITELVLEELGVQCERVKLDLRAGDTKKPDFLKLNPNGKVPLIVHDGVSIFESEWTPKEQHNEKTAEVALKDVHECLRILDAALDGRQFLTGEYTVADTHVSSFIDWLRHMKVDCAKYARLEAWSKRCAERPAYKKLMAQGA
jgi:glutathione S-transferase